MCDIFDLLKFVKNCQKHNVFWIILVFFSALRCNQLDIVDSGSARLHISKISCETDFVIFLVKFKQNNVKEGQLKFDKLIVRGSI